MNDHAQAHPDAAPQISPIRLDHAAIMTTQLEAAVDFYTHLMGLTLRVIEDDPIRKGRQRALLVDDAGRDILEIIAMPELAHPAIPGRGGLHHLGFRLPPRDWHSLRARLDASRYHYQEIEGRLFVRDLDGLILEVEQL